MKKTVFLIAIFSIACAGLVLVAAAKETRSSGVPPLEPMSSTPKTIGGMMLMSEHSTPFGQVKSEDNILILGDVCHTTFGAANSNDYFATIPSAPRIGDMYTTVPNSVPVRNTPLDDADLAYCEVPHSRQSDWSTTTFVGEAIQMNACSECNDGMGSYWDYSFMDYSESDGDTFWYAGYYFNTIGVNGKMFDGGWSWMAHRAGVSPYFEVYIYCIGSGDDYLVWSGEKTVGHDPDGEYTRTGGCENTGSFIWNKL